MKLPSPRQRGTSLVEVLVTLVIVAIGLLSLAALESRLHVSEAESYQRAQALVLLKDMASRISTNRTNADAYVSGSGGNPASWGAGMTCPNDAATRQQIDEGQWCRALQGAGERSGAASVGGMIGARGCVEALGNRTYMITVAWQGLAPISAPPASVTCGSGAYSSTAACANDLCRRVVTTVVQIGNL